MTSPKEFQSLATFGAEFIHRSGYEVLTATGELAWLDVSLVDFHGDGNDIGLFFGITKEDSSRTGVVFNRNPLAKRVLDGIDRILAELTESSVAENGRGIVDASDAEAPFRVTLRISGFSAGDSTGVKLAFESYDGDDVCVFLSNRQASHLLAAVFWDVSDSSGSRIDIYPVETISYESLEKLGEPDREPMPTFERKE